MFLSPKSSFIPFTFWDVWGNSYIFEHFVQPFCIIRFVCDKVFCSSRMCEELFHVTNIVTWQNMDLCPKNSCCSSIYKQTYFHKVFGCMTKKFVSIIWTLFACRKSRTVDCNNPPTNARQTLN